MRLMVEKPLEYNGFRPDDDGELMLTVVFMMMMLLLCESMMTEW